jgi:hypothetical protein
MSKPLEWKELWDAVDANPDQWIETTEAMYHEMLGVVPPIAQKAGSFLVGEALRHNADGQSVHACFKQKCCRFFARNMTVSQFKGGAA